VNARAAQLDGLRAVAMLAICWDHWRPEAWARWFPYEISLFFFLVMTGYLITGSLLRERERSEAEGKPWRMRALRVYQIRRGLRILAPYYAALAIAFIVGAKDLWAAPLWYVLHVSNLHMATLPDWPDGTNHFWSLSMQQQFYLVWPFVIWFLPKRSLVWAMLLFAAIGPATRWFHDDLARWFARPDLLTPACFDYFGIGGLLALAVHRGMSLESPGLRCLSVIAFACYLTIYGLNAAGYPTPGFRSFQQTFLAVSLCGFIAAATVGFPGLLGRVLLLPWLQRIGALSYGVYLFHNLAPLVVGKPFWFLWGPLFQGVFWDLVRMGLFGAVTWLLALASWRWIEEPLQNVRSRIRRE
jgi:peptidoglycan/LPS O-acetylase OafA/YrhL